MKLKFIITSLIVSFLMISCKTVDLEKVGTDSETEKNAESLEEEKKANETEIEDYLISERVKEVDVEKTIVYVDRPVYYPANEPLDKPELKGKAAAKKSTDEALQTPERWTGGTMYYDFDEDLTYEIYCQPYRVTDMALEPGEQLVEMPFLSEEKVWEIGAGVYPKNGQDEQHFFLKPAYSGLVTSFIIITDRRIYHLLLKSFKDCYMTQVRWNYPNTMPFKIKTDAMQKSLNGMNRLSSETSSVDPRYLSFDYTMSYSIFKKPYWLPTRVYDDGSKTYIVMNETVLHMTSPVLFNHKNERINYSVDKTLIIIPELIEKVTMRVGKEKVTVKKKNYKEPKKTKIPEEEIEEEKTLSHPDSSNNFQSSMNSNNNRETQLRSSDIYVEAKIQDKMEKLQKQREKEMQQQLEAANANANGGN